uniref:Uncharacterized protein LOC100377080 n=1 Tax=Saccoglossus kowalevskii TaxID=10224 RepID=A0ABM0MD42_SACKO|nr:PREDICTED: uncharacterized protein LOC100377080 [Saccoglossus kowalevskii]
MLDDCIAFTCVTLFTTCGHALGEHESTYTATPTTNGVVFRRKKHGHIVPNAETKHEKEILYNSDLKLPHTINIEERFSAPREADPNYDMFAGIPGDKRKKEQNEMHDYDIPEMASSSTGTLKYLSTELLQFAHINVTITQPDNLVNDSIQIAAYIKNRVPLEEIVSEIKGNLSCVWKNKVIESVERSSCFNKLVQLLSRLSPTNLTIVAERYITNNASSEKEVAYRNIVIDSLGAVATETSQMLLTEMIFLSNNPDPNLVFRTLSHFLALQKPPPGKFVDVLMKMAFKKTFVFPDDKNTTNVHHKALLVLGSVAEVLLQSEPQKAYGIVAQLEDTLGVHDPVNHRHTRSIMSDKEYQSHLHNKAILIHSLGNAAFDSSYEYFISYMNNTGSPSLLRRSGVLSVSRYSHEQAANTLLDMAMNDHEEHVRYAATIEYQRHPHALDFDELIQEYVAVHTNRTDIADTDGESNRPLYRSRRSILDGFQFELKLPFVDWGKTIGSKAIGASIGFLMRNFLNLDIKPFSGNLNVHVEDAAWAIAHIGLLNLNLEFVHAKLCFKGHGSYSLNILQEFGFYDIIELVKKYDGVVRNMINSVENTIKTFKNLLSSAESNANSVFDDFVAVIEDLPNRIRDLRNIGKNLVRVIGEYSGLPEFVTDVRNIVDRVSTLVNDIKTDVMEFYNSIVDTITVTLPWAAEQIMDAIEAAAQAVKKLFKSPRTAITDIAKSIYKIKAAIAGVFDAKNRIVKACFFLDGQKPYWFNLRDEIAGIVEDILNAKDNLGDALEWITEGAKDDDTFKKFTGVPLSTIKQQIIDEIWGEFDTLITPVRMIERLAEPFVLAYDSFVGTIESIKQAYEGIKRAYDDAKTTINKIFGPKMGKKFPRVIATGSCGDGRFENTNQNTLPGIDLEANAGDELTAPFDGTVSVTGNNQITLVITRELKDNEIILYNVILDPGLENQHVSKDHRIGTVASSDCSPNIIHLSLRTQEVHEYIDPTSYLMKREMPPPGWHIECDDYVLIYKMKVEMSGSITGGAVKSDTSPDRTSEPDTSDMDSIAKRRKRGIINDLFGAAKDFVDGLGFPGIDELGPVFDFNMNALNVGNVFDFLENAQMTPLKDQLEMLLEKLQNAINTAGCQRPESMDIKELRNGLQLKKKSTTGSRDELVKRYLESEEKCFGLRNALSKNIYCTFDEHCLGVTCCIDLQLGPYLHRSFNAYVQYNPCNFELVIGVDSWTKTFNLIDFDFADADEEGEPTIESIDVLDAVKITVKHKIEMTDGKITVTLETELCATEVDICLAPVKILDEATIDVPLCDEVMQEHVDSVKQQQETGTGIVMSELTLGELEILLDQYGIDEKDVTNLLTDLRKLYQEMTKEAINTKLSEIFDDEFTNFDMCMDGDVHMERGANFFDYRIDFMVGPIPMYLGFGSGGTFGMTYGTNVCLLSMIAELTVRPQIGAQIYGYLGINLYVLTAELRMTGYLMTISFPTKAQIQFDHFPIDVAARMDMNLVPLRLELRAILTFEIYINLAFSSIHIKKILYNQGVSFKRSASQANQGCFVHQVEGRDYTDPAYELELSVEDDKSEVDMTFCIGTYKGGCDVLKDESMGGFSTVFEQVLRGGVPLYYTISAKNSAGAVAKATCELPTYDVTLPGGRVVPDFLSTSHPNILKASAVALDDSIIMQREEAVGYGQDIFGDQVIIWNSFEMEKINHEVDIGLHDPLGTKSLEYFASPRLGRLRSTSHHTTSYLYATNCAKDCLALPPTKCLSFNYDYGENGLCELMEEIEGHGVELHENGYFYNFERLGIGHAVEFIHDDLQLRHNDLHLFNIHLNNSLGYSNIINSKGVLVDFVPPEPGPINNAIFDAVSHETCTEYVPDEWENRCIEETPLPNHRSIVDGFGSSCVFNGHETLVDMLYTRANKYVSANWDGFHDLETHIFGYTWTVGTDHCLDDIHPHKDPHSHLFDESEWTHTGIAHPLELDDGQYHVTVRALNKVEFGGPLATTVCHTTPYTIDNTPPLVHDVNLIEYDEIACHIITEYNVSDPHSGIREIDFGLGRSNRDVYLLGWQRHDNITHIGLDYCIADGIPAWIKIRAINNVDLRTVGHSDFPILVDRSHPIPGDVFDGSQHGVDIDYQSTSDAICANWQNFLDMESGIRKYTWGVGTFPGGDDVVSFYDLPHTVLQQCSMNVSLTHNTTYYTTIFAYNAGHKSLNVSVISDGVLYDATPPIEGELRDGLDPNIDMSYSSELATVSANWNGYSDPESGIGEYDVSVYRRHADFDNGTESILKSSMQLIHVVTSLTPDTDHINWHHFHLHHGDFVYVELDAVNQADNPTTTQSDGFTIDVTNPIMHFLGDGINAGVDRQYTSSTSELSANWEFQDPESGIDHYKLAVYQTQGGTRRQIYPQDRTKSLSISPDQNDWTSDNPLTLLTGRHYSIRVTAVNGAGLSTVHDTDGVIVDPTPPRMRKIFVGVLAGESEEIFDGFVLQTDPNGILATWFATDAESGIVAYWVAVGTTPEGTDVSDYRNMGSKRDGYVDELSLQLYNTAANGPVYYITVKAENGAGSMSESLTSSPIKVLQGDIAGITDDGPDTQTIGTNIVSVDTDYQKEDTVVTAQFHGFGSQVHGIVYYEWAVGTQPRLDDIQPYTDAGIVVDNQHGNPGEGLSGSGKAQMPLQLDSGVTYFTTVRAITGAGNALDSVSDGFTVDLTSPVITIDSLGVIVDNNTLNLDVNTAHYQESVDSLAAEWEITEDESTIIYTSFSYGSYPGADDIYNITDVTEIYSVPNGMVVPEGNGKPNILALKSINQVGLWTETISGSVTVDTSPPIAGIVECPRYSVAIDELFCSWSHFYDDESFISHYEFGIGISEGDDSLFSYKKIESHINSYRARDLHGGSLQHSGRYYVTIIAYNGVGLKSQSFSQPIVIDDTPPVQGSVIEWSGVDEIDVSVDDTEKSSTCTTDEECALLDVVCQKSLTQISVTWQPFQDPESPIIRYQVAAGTSPGGTQLQEYQDVPLDSYYTVITGLDLTDIEVGYVSVKATNAAGLTSTAMSNGVFISRISLGLPSLRSSHVWDGNGDKDL